jgi:hypothetical protein
MPENTKMKWSENGGMSPTGKSIEITGNQILFTEKKMRDNEPRKWSAEISSEDKEQLYQVFVKNKFDKIENDKRVGIVYDAGSEGVYIRAGKVSKNVSYGPNSPLSGSNKKRYSAVAIAIKALEAKYKDSNKTNNDEKFAVLDFSNQSYSYIFKNAKPTNLNQVDINQVQSLIEKAVKEFNTDKEKMKYYGEIEDLQEYKFQLIPVLNEKNEKEVYVNAFCDDFNKELKKELVVVDDGGNCFFQLYVNLNTNSYRDFSVNGSA